MRCPPPLRLEIAAARGVGGLSRRLGAAAGRRFPASSSRRSTPARSTGSRRGLRLDARSSRRRTGRRPRRRWRRRSCARAHRLAHNAAGANLVSGVASALLARRGMPSSGCSRSTRARCRSSCHALRPRVLCLGNLFRDQLDRYGELELVAERWRDAVDELPADARVVFNADDPQLAAIGEAHAGGVAVRSRRSARGPCRRSSTRPTRSTASAAARRYEYAAAYVGHLGDYRCPNGDHETTAARGRRAGDRAAGAGACCVPARHAGGRAPRSSSRLPGLYNVYNASRQRRSPARSARRSTRSPPGSSASPPRSGASSGSRSATSGSSCS